MASGLTVSSSRWVFDKAGVCDVTFACANTQSSYSLLHLRCMVAAHAVRPSATAGYVRCMGADRTTSPLSALPRFSNTSRAVFSNYSQR